MAVLRVWQAPRSGFLRKSGMVWVEERLADGRKVERLANSKETDAFLKTKVVGRPFVPAHPDSNEAVLPLSTAERLNQALLDTSTADLRVLMANPDSHEGRSIMTKIREQVPVGSDISENVLAQAEVVFNNRPAEKHTVKKPAVVVPAAEKLVPKGLHQSASAAASGDPFNAPRDPGDARPMAVKKAEWAAAGETMAAKVEKSVGITHRKQAQTRNNENNRGLLRKKAERPSDEVLEIVAKQHARNKGDQSIMRLITELTPGEPLTKAQGKQLTKGYVKEVKEKGLTREDLLQGFVYWKQNEAEMAPLLGEVRHAAILAEAAKTAEADALKYGRKVESQSPLSVIGGAGRGQASKAPGGAPKAAQAVGAKVAADAVLAKAKKAYPGLAAVWRGLKAPSHLKGARFLGKVVLRTPAWLPGFIAVVFMIGVAHTAWDFVANGGVTPGTVYATHAGAAVLTSVANAAIAVVNALLYGFTVLAKVFVLGLIQVVVGVIDLVLGGIMDFMGKLGFKGTEVDLDKNMFSAEPYLRFAYLEVGGPDSCSQDIIHIQGCGSSFFITDAKEVVAFEAASWNPADLVKDAVESTGNFFVGIGHGFQTGWKHTGGLLL